MLEIKFLIAAIGSIVYAYIFVRAVSTAYFKSKSQFIRALHTSVDSDSDEE